MFSFILLSQEQNLHSTIDTIGFKTKTYLWKTIIFDKGGWTIDICVDAFQGKNFLRPKQKGIWNSRNMIKQVTR